MSTPPILLDRARMKEGAEKVVARFGCAVACIALKCGHDTVRRSRRVREWPHRTSSRKRLAAP